MNCLAEAIGLALPGNGSLLATHADRKVLFQSAARRIVDLAKAYYEGGDESVLPRNIATKAAFENAMTVDVAMGGSTNTILHMLAMAAEAEVDFTMADIDRISARCHIFASSRPRRRLITWRICIVRAASWRSWVSCSVVVCWMSARGRFRG